jgi:hypothetical protein
MEQPGDERAFTMKRPRYVEKLPLLCRDLGMELISWIQLFVQYSEQHILSKFRNSHFDPSSCLGIEFNLSSPFT